jgi:hypothetical protein
VDTHSMASSKEMYMDVLDLNAGNIYVHEVKIP